MSLIINFIASVAVRAAIRTSISMLQGNSFGDVSLDGAADSVLLSDIFAFGSVFGLLLLNKK